MEIKKYINTLKFYINWTYYDYAFPIDTDDFFTPRVPGRTQLKDYISEYCYVKPYGSCTFKWIWLNPQLCGMKSKVGRDGNVTDNLSSQKGKQHEVCP